MQKKLATNKKKSKIIALCRCLAHKCRLETMPALHFYNAAEETPPDFGGIVLFHLLLLKTFLNGIDEKAGVYMFFL